jgi:prepilin-type N-terminal cleavage/methylation domain-containing protein
MEKGWALMKDGKTKSKAVYGRRLVPKYDILELPQTISHKGIPTGADFDDRGFTITETLTAIAVVTLLLSVLLVLLSSTSTNTVRSRETLFFLREFLEFDRKIREKAGAVIIPYWERTVTLSGFSPERRSSYGAVLEIPYYGGLREGILRLSIDRENRLSLESGRGEEREYFNAPAGLLVKDIEVLHDGEGRPLALKLSFEYRNKQYYTVAPFAAFPVKRVFYG